MTKLIFCDRDNTLVTTKPGIEHAQMPSDLVPMHANMLKLMTYCIQGYMPIIVSNQAGIADGYKTLQQVREEMLLTMQWLSYSPFALFCPDWQGEQCYYVKQDYFLPLHHMPGFKHLIGEFRKPKKGMVEAGKIIMGASLPGQADCIMFGDSRDDAVCAQLAEIPFVQA